ncbi:hypothetical protein [Gordonia sp. GN26]
MTHIVPAARLLAALVFSAALAGGVATANAQPCQMLLPNGKLAPCAPDVISTAPGEYGGGGNDGASDPASFEHTLLDTTPAVAAPEEEPTDGPVDENQIEVPQPEEKDPDKEKEEKAQKEKEEREQKEREQKEKEEREQKEKEEQEQKEKEEKEQNG